MSLKVLYLLVATTGLASLSWEVLWQIKAALALGVSAWGTAITLAATMGGMCIGSLLSGWFLKERKITHPARYYAFLEIIIGLSGLLLSGEFRVVERLDTAIYATDPDHAPLLHILAIVAVLGIPTMCMGATMPVFAVIARTFRTSIAILYGLNTLGAATGALIAALFLIPVFGVTHAAWAIASLNMAVAAAAFCLNARGALATLPRQEPIVEAGQLSPRLEEILVAVTGFSTFVLEVAWFRALTAAFTSTTDTFALILSSVLIGLGIAAWLAPILKKMKVPLGALVALAGVLILLVTPVMERFDQIVGFNMHPFGLRPVKLSSTLVPSSSEGASYFILSIGTWFFMTLAAVGMPIAMLGIAVPSILDDQRSQRRVGVLYAINTFFAIVGSIATAWLFLPTLGFARSCWMVGLLLAGAGILVAPRQKRLFWGILGVLAFCVAVTFESGIGKTRVQGRIVYNSDFPPTKVLESYEGPESTVSAVEYGTDGRSLIVDGFVTASQLGPKGTKAEHYMAWMGHLPMLLAPHPENALVICFGTGQTANAVREENPRSLDIVDINPRVFKLAHNFEANKDVLHDPRVMPIVMDGRAYMRRSTKTYDVITLEPMPPTFAGVNSLYSKEFYELARKRLSAHGVIAQWLPFHLVDTRYAPAILKTFQSVFPDAILWVDPISNTGIILGNKDDNGDLGTVWPGFKRTPIEREYNEDQIKNAVALYRTDAERYGALGQVITDDNQLLAYGEAVNGIIFRTNLARQNKDLLDKIKSNP